LANNAKTITQLNACTAPQSTDFVVIVSNTSGEAETMYATTNNLFNNASANVTVNVVTGATLVITGNSTPANNTDNSNRPNNAIWTDGDFIYMWNGTEIKRAALSTF